MCVNLSAESASTVHSKMNGMCLLFLKHNVIATLKICFYCTNLRQTDVIISEYPF